MNWNSPVFFIPLLLLYIVVSIESIHIYMHRKYCKIDAEWMNNQEAMTYDIELQVE